MKDSNTKSNFKSHTPIQVKDFIKWVKQQDRNMEQYISRFKLLGATKMLQKANEILVDENAKIVFEKEKRQEAERTEDRYERYVWVFTYKEEIK